MQSQPAATAQLTETVKTAIHRDGPEAVRSFAAGALYMAAVAGLGFAALTSASSLSKFALPQLIEEIAPEKFPRYAAHDLNRANRWNPDRWDTEIANEHGNENNAAKLANIDESLVAAP